MAVRDLIPWGRSRSSVPSMMPGDEVSPFVALQREMNRLFDDVFNRFDTGMPSLLGRTPGLLGGAWPSVEVNASENEVRVSAELPGMDEKDVEVLVDNDILTIRGEKKSENEDPGRRFSEHYYGRFQRSIALPFEVARRRRKRRSRMACSPLPSRNRRRQRTRRSGSPSTRKARPNINRMARPAGRTGSPEPPGRREVEHGPCAAQRGSDGGDAEPRLLRTPALD